MKYETLEDLFVLKLASLYDIESEILKALPKMAKSVYHPGLAQALKDHLAETEEQKERLGQIFAMIGKKPKKARVEAVRGLVADAKWVMDQDMSPEALDMAIIGAARYVEHYEMAGYLSLRAWAEELGMKDAVKLLDKTLSEEERADETLEALADTEVADNLLASALETGDSD